METILGALHDHGLGFLAAIIGLRAIKDVSLSDAKHIVHASAAYADARGDREASWQAMYAEIAYEPGVRVLEFGFNDRVTVRASERTVARGIAGLVGYVAAKARESEDTEVLSYGVFLDQLEQVYIVEPDDLEPAPDAGA